VPPHLLWLPAGLVLALSANARELSVKVSLAAGPMTDDATGEEPAARSSASVNTSGGKRSCSEAEDEEDDAGGDDDGAVGGASAAGRWRGDGRLFRRVFGTEGYRQRSSKLGIVTASRPRRHGAASLVRGGDRSLSATPSAADGEAATLAGLLSTPVQQPLHVGGLLASPAAAKAVARRGRGSRSASFDARELPPPPTIASHPPALLPSLQSRAPPSPRPAPAAVAAGEEAGATGSTAAASKSARDKEARVAEWCRRKDEQARLERARRDAEAAAEAACREARERDRAEKVAEAKRRLAAARALEAHRHAEQMRRLAARAKDAAAEAALRAEISRVREQGWVGLASVAPSNVNAAVAIAGVGTAATDQSSLIPAARIGRMDVSQADM